MVGRERTQDKTTYGPRDPFGRTLRPLNMAVLLRATMWVLPLFFVTSTGFFFPFPTFPVFPTFPGWPPIDDTPQETAEPSPAYEDTQFLGRWELFKFNGGVSAMHMAITHTNKAIVFDATDFGPSLLRLLPGKKCRNDPSYTQTNGVDCWAHAAEIDLTLGSIRPLTIETDTWCSSGGFDANGTLVHTGGFNDGIKGLRHLSATENSDWIEHTPSLAERRWYASNQVLPDGRMIIVGGRRAFSYELIPTATPTIYKLPFLYETTDDVEDNLYPFVVLSTDGNIFIFANNRSILLDYNKNRIIKEFPALPGGSRNYPGSAMSTLMPLRLDNTNGETVPAEVLICGGSPSLAMTPASGGNFLPALDDCARLTITDPNPEWQIERMPSPRVMGDMLLLPNTEILMINGAKNGTSGWDFAREPNFSPVIYRPLNPESSRFKVLNPSRIPRMYHATSAVLPDGKILVAGSNTNPSYNLNGVLYPTELRIEKFLPPYLDPALHVKRPVISTEKAVNTVTYGQEFSVPFRLLGFDVEEREMMVTMYAPPFTTHGYSMNQRLLVLQSNPVRRVGLTDYEIEVVAPPSSVIAPAGYYMLFVVSTGVPSKAMWVHIQ